MLKNLVKNIFVAIVSLMAAAPAAAQSETVTISEEERALALSSYTNGECYEGFVSPDGLLTWEGHGGVYTGLAGNGAFHSFSNNDGVSGTGSKFAPGADILLGYRCVRTDWAFAIRGEVFGGFNGSYEVENREVKTNFHAGALALVENSHGLINFGVGMVYEYNNLVSENTNMTPWRGNAHYWGPVVRLTTKIFSIKTTKTAKVGNKNILVRGLREAHLFVEGSYKFASVGKYWDDADALQKGAKPELKDKLLTVRIGVTFNIR